MNVLMLYCRTGGGHIAAGKALQDELKLRGHCVDLVDTYTLVSDRLAEWIGHSYDSMVQKTPFLWGMFYQIGRFRSRLPFHTLVYKLNRYMAEPMRKYFKDHPYDVILALHVFPAEMLGGMKEQGIPIPKTILVATDYTCPPLTAEADNDYYIVPSEQLTEEYLAEEIPQSRLRTLGIPVRKEFTTAGTKPGSPAEREIRRRRAATRLGLDPDRHYLLLSGGSIGAGQIWTAAKTIAGYLKSRPTHDLNIICGSHDALYDKLQKQYCGNPQIHLLRHTDSMADYMYASDILISKPGGLTSTEAAVCGVPLIHISPIPGCEQKNASFFMRRGMSLHPANCRRQLTAALQQLEDPAVAEEMIRRQQQGINPRAAADICDFAEQLARAEHRTADCTDRKSTGDNGAGSYSMISHSLC